MATREDILYGQGRPSSGELRSMAEGVIQPRAQQLQAEHQANQAREAEQRSYEAEVKRSAAVPRSVVRPRTKDEMFEEHLNRDWDQEVYEDAVKVVREYPLWSDDDVIREMNRRRMDAIEPEIADNPNYLEEYRPAVQEARRYLEKDYKKQQGMAIAKNASDLAKNGIVRTPQQNPATPRAQQRRAMNSVPSNQSSAASKANASKPTNNATSVRGSNVINQQFNNFNDWLAGQFDMETPEQRKKRERRDRARRIISAVGDGITSIANMYFANNGGIPLVKPQLGQTLNKRLQEERQYREANRDRFVNALLRGEANRQSAIRNDALSQYRANQAEIQAEENKRKAEADAARKANQEEVNRLKKRQLDLRERELNIREDYNNKRISNQEFDNETKRIRAEVARNNQRLKELGEETTITSTDKYGNKTEKTVVKVPAGSGSEDSGSSLSSGGSGKDYSQYKQKDFSKYKRNNK